jgi:O-antigen/teichoic acid export membrane protein
VISKSFIKSSVIYTVAGTLPLASAVILLPFYIHYLSSEAFGAFSLFLSFSILVQIITTFSYDATLYIHFHEFKNDAAKLSRYVSSALILVAANGLLVFLFFFAFGQFFTDLFFDDGSRLSFYPYGYVCLLVGIFQSFFKIHNSLLQTRQNPVVFFWANLLSFSIIAGLTVGGLMLYPDSLFGPLGARLCAAVIAGTWACGRMIKEFGISYDFALMRSSLSFNFYTFVYQLQQWVMNHFDRFLIAFFLPLSQVGVYSFAVQCLMVIEFVVNGLFASFYPKVVSAVMDQKEKVATPEINRYYYGLTAVILLLVASSILLFPVVLKLFVSKEAYLLSIPLIPFLSLIYIFKGLRMYFSIPYGILKYTKPLPGIYLVVSAVKVAGMFLLIDLMGVYGVILSALISVWLEIVLLYKWGNPKFQYKFNGFKLIGLPVALTLIIAGVEWFTGGSHSTLISGGYVFFCVIALFWVYRKEVRLIHPARIFKNL